MMMLSVQSSDNRDVRPERLISAPSKAARDPELTIISEFSVRFALSPCTKIPEYALSSVDPHLVSTVQLYSFVTFVSVFPL